MLLQETTGGRFPYGTISADDLLAGLDLSDYQALASIEEHIKVPPANIVFAVGDQPRRIFVHRSGRALLYWTNGITNTKNACPADLNHIFGLIEALSGRTFSASMKTITSNEFDVIGADDLFNFLRDQPASCFKLAEILSRKCQYVMQMIRSH